MRGVVGTNLRKALVIGCGSMGKRRIRDLIGAGLEVMAFDLRPDRRETAASQFRIRTVARLEEALAEQPDAAAVSVPPSLHGGMVLAALRAGCHVFSEAPLCLSMAELDEIESAARAAGKLVAPSCTWLHYPFHSTLKKMVETADLGPILCFHSHFGAHLAGWHPYEGLNFYAADRRNGGMGFDVLVHQIQLFQWLAGPARSVLCQAVRRSSLSAASGYDIYDVLLDSGSITAALHCDVLQRPPDTQWRAWGEACTVEWTWESMRIRPASGEVRVEKLPAGYTYEDVYRAEIRHFVAAAQGERTYARSLQDERQVLRALLAAEESASRGRAVILAPAAVTG